MTMNVPLLGGKVWVCEKGHRLRAPQPWRFLAPMGQGQAIASPPACVMCFCEWVGAQFPVELEPGSDGEVLS